MRKKSDVEPIDRGWWCPAVRALFPKACSHLQDRHEPRFVIVVARARED